MSASNDANPGTTASPSQEQQQQQQQQQQQRGRRQSVLHGKSRERMIAESLRNGEEVQKLYPAVDFKGAVVEPTINFTFDIQEHVDEAKQRRYNTLIAELIEHTSDPPLAERLLWEARECLTGYPHVLAQFDDIFINKRPVPVMIRELHEVLLMKKATERRMSQQQNLNAESSSGARP